ncbi:MAG: hypothetical protein PHT02_00940 [Tissierellia bacterium]|nr:hypothetical protein [Tissierellia bacterium]
MSAVYDISLYNRELKQRFMTTYEEGTQKSLIFIFNKSAQLEYSLGKDIFEFNREELDDLFLLFNSTSKQSVASRFSIIGKYIDFAIEQGFLKTGINLVKNLSGEEYYNKYISKIAERRKILDTKQFDNLEDFCVNDQDAAAIAIIREGARGRQEAENELEELVNLKIEDCNFDTNEVILTRNNGKTRIIAVSDKTMEALKDANAQEIYIRKNGEIDDWTKEKKNNKMNLHKTGYIFKPTAKSDFGQITAKALVQRISMIKQLYGNPFITVTNLWLSGMAEYGRKIKTEKGRELEKEDYKEICRRFGHNEVYWSKIKGKIKNYI